MNATIRWPQHEGGLYLEHNPHKTAYENVEQWLEENEDSLEWSGAEEREKAIESGSLWVLQWYPRTPVGFYYLASSTFEALMDVACSLDNLTDSLRDAIGWSETEAAR